MVDILQFVLAWTNFYEQGQNLGQVFNCRSGCKHAPHLLRYEAKQPNLKLKTQPEQHSGSFLNSIAFPDYSVAMTVCCHIVHIYKNELDGPHYHLVHIFS